MGAFVGIVVTVTPVCLLVRGATVGILVGATSGILVGNMVGKVVMAFVGIIVGANKISGCLGWYHSWNVSRH